MIPKVRRYAQPVRKAVIDVGSNSLLLLVAERVGCAWESVFEASRITGLGEGVKSTGILGEEPMTRSLHALWELVDLAHKHGAQSVRSGATMAVRMASNANDFLTRAAAQGTPVEVISGDQEAELGFRSVAEDPRFSGADRLSIIDPGGQSTELVVADRVGDRWDIHFRRSFPVGTLGLQAPEVLGFREILDLTRQIDEIIGMAFRPNEHGTPVVLGATGTNLISIREKMAMWDPERVHGQTLDYEEVSKAAGWLGKLTNEERAAVPGMEPGRERTIHLGALILERFLFALRAYEVKVSVRGWRWAWLG